MHGVLIELLLSLQPCQWSETRCAGGVLLHETRPRGRKSQQSQSVPRRCSVENHMVEHRRRTRVTKKPREFVERGDLQRAGAGKLFFHARNRRGWQLCPVRTNHPLAVFGRRFLRVEIHRRQSRHRGDGSRMMPERCPQHFIEIRGRVRRNEQNLLTRINQPNRRSARQRSFADAPFAGEEQVASGLIEELHGTSFGECGKSSGLRLLSWFVIAQLACDCSAAAAR